MPKSATKIGEAGALTIDPQGFLYYSLVYPYEIRKISKDGKVVDRFKRPLPMANIPTAERQASGIVNMSVTYAPRGLAVLPNGMLLHLFFLRKNMESPRKFYADLFSPDGEWLLTAYLSELETSSTYPILHVDAEGYIYINQRKPYPAVNKYSLSIVDISS